MEGDQLPQPVVGASRARPQRPEEVLWSVTRFREKGHTLVTCQRGGLDGGTHPEGPALLRGQAQLPGEAEG